MKECVNVNEIEFEVYKKILVIEHDEKYNKQLSEKLNTLDYIVSSSKSYKETTKLLGEENFDYIIVNNFISFFSACFKFWDRSCVTPNKSCTGTL